MSKSLPSHIAILVPSVRKAADKLKKFQFQIGPEEVWESEGTKEIYLEREKGNSLLLLEPTKDGPYQRALKKRGPGIHHLAIDVLNLEAFIESLLGTGWLLHPTSLKTIKHTQTAYLARPGFPALIEVQEREKLIEKSLFVDEILLRIDPMLVGLVRAIGLDKIVKPTVEAPLISMGGHSFEISGLV